MSTATGSLVGDIRATIAVLDGDVTCDGFSAAAVAFSAAAFRRRQRRVIVATTAIAPAISAAIALDQA